MKKKTLLQRFLIDPISKEISKDFKRLENNKLKTTAKPDTFQWAFPPTFNMPLTSRFKPKPEGRVSYHLLRNFSVHYPIARSCIDYLKTKVIKLDWVITAIDDEDDVDTDDPRIVLLTDFFKHPLGNRSKYRDFVDAILEDYLVIGAISLERLMTKGGQFLAELKLVDSGTIRLKVDEFGRLPEPPDVAYVQFIRGKKTAELTQDELIYVNRNNRANTVYGLSPIESIIIQAESAIQGSLYSLRWFSDGNVPEGFGHVPDDWTKEQVKQFQSYFDSLIAGNPKFQRRIKMVPKDFNYQATKKPSEIGYERFEQWLLQQTCSVFGVPPQDIGFTHQINKSTSDTQKELGQERGMRPLVCELEEMFTDIIQRDFNYPDLKFKYVDVDPVDKKKEAEIDRIRLEDGVTSVDEIRTREGQEPIGLGHYVKAGKNVVLVKDLTTEQENEEKEEKEDDSMERIQRSELTKWRRQSITAFKNKKRFKKFKSNVLEDWMIDEIYDQLKKVTKREYINKVFEPYFTNKMQAVRDLVKLSDEIKNNQIDK